MKTHDENMKELKAGGAGWEHRYCWYVPGSTSIVDSVLIDKSSGHPVGACGREPWDGIKARYPGVELWVFDEAFVEVEKAQAKAYRHPPVEITRDRYMEMLCVLPPNNWERHDATESFKMCEHLCGVYTGIFVRVGNKFFEMTDSFCLPHLLILAEVEKAFPMLNMKTGAMHRARHLTCAVCGGSAPAYKQWWNRDTGYGCCPSCYREAVEREGEAEAVSHYGVKGVHHSINEPENDGVVGGIPPLVQTESVETPLGEQLDGGGEVDL